MSEQYWMPKRLDTKNLRACIRHYSPERLFIRAVGSMGAGVMVNENLVGKTLGFQKTKSGLSMVINRKLVYHFTLKEEYQKGFSLEYERVRPSDDGIGRMVYLSQGVDPYDPILPEPRRSILRTVLDRHLMEITFPGRVHLKFHSWWIEPYWKYWIVVKPKIEDDVGNSHS